MSWKKFLLPISNILGQFVNSLISNDNHSLLNKVTLMQLIHIDLSKKRRTFSESSSTFLEFGLNFEYFEVKDDPLSLCISEIRDCQARG